MIDILAVLAVVVIIGALMIIPSILFLLYVNYRLGGK